MVEVRSAEYVWREIIELMETSGIPTHSARNILSGWRRETFAAVREAAAKIARKYCGQGCSIKGIAEPEHEGCETALTIEKEIRALRPEDVLR